MTYLYQNLTAPPPIQKPSKAQFLGVITNPSGKGARTLDHDGGSVGTFRNLRHREKLIHGVKLECDTAPCCARFRSDGAKPFDQACRGGRSANLSAFVDDIAWSISDLEQDVHKECFCCGWWRAAFKGVV